MGSGREFVPECEILCEEGSVSQSERYFSSCSKNPGHKSFIPVDKLCLEHLPEEWRHGEYMDVIQIIIDSTVKVLVKSISHRRPDTYPHRPQPYPYSQFRGQTKLIRSGTGYLLPVSDHSRLVKSNQACPCPLCQNSEEPQMKFIEAIVQTTTHVVFDDSEAQHSIFECFYDSEDKSSVKRLYGISVCKSSVHLDMCSVKCVSHDDALIKRLCSLMSECKRIFERNCGRLQEICNPGRRISKGFCQHGMRCGLHFNSVCARNCDGEAMHAVMVSHPHGMSKYITFGNIISNVFIDKFDSDPFDPFDQPSRNLTSLKSSSLSIKEQSSLSTKEQSSLSTKQQSSLSTKEQSSLSIKEYLLCNSGDGTFTCSRRLLPGYTSGFPLKCGVEYQLPDGLRITIPHGNDQYLTSKYISEPDGSVEFPSGTKLTLPDQTELVVPIESENENEGVLLEWPISFRDRPFYFTYNVDSCPGSSGATLLCYSFPSPIPVHAGTFGSGLNRSALIDTATKKETDCLKSADTDTQNCARISSLTDAHSLGIIGNHLRKLADEQSRTLTDYQSIQQRKLFSVIMNSNYSWLNLGVGDSLSGVLLGLSFVCHLIKKLKAYKKIKTSSV